METRLPPAGPGSSPGARPVGTEVVVVGGGALGLLPPRCGAGAAGWVREARPYRGRAARGRASPRGRARRVPPRSCRRGFPRGGGASPRPSQKPNRERRSTSHKGFSAGGEGWKPLSAVGGEREPSSARDPAGIELVGGSPRARPRSAEAPPPPFPGAARLRLTSRREQARFWPRGGGGGVEGVPCFE